MYEQEGGETEREREHRKHDTGIRSFLVEFIRRTGTEIGTVNKQTFELVVIRIRGGCDS